MVEYSQRDDIATIRWSLEIKKRAHFSCELCGKKGDLHAHHLNSWDVFIDERHDIFNGICLCGGLNGCHMTFHKKYGKGNNTRAQWEEFEAIYKTLHKLAEDNYDKANIIKDILKKVEADGYI